MYEAFYGFSEKPFSMLPDPGFLFLSKKHRAALTLLEYGLLNHVGFCVISGEPGAGKTTILRALLERVPDDVTVGLITNTHQSFGSLLDWVLSAFDLHRPDLTHVEKHQIFMEYLIEEYANNRNVLLIVDEAQNMDANTLEELRMLSNVNSEKDQLMQIMLSGQPGLRDLLRKPELMQFAQRIAVDYHLNSLDLKETCGYIQHRLITAGAQQEVFTPAACERIHCYSGGTPRLINLLCDTVLVYGFADQQKLIDVELVDEMVHERMKDSVVPIVNRDVINQDKSEVCKQLEEDFPWIQSQLQAKGLKLQAKELKQSVSTKTNAADTVDINPGAEQQTTETPVELDIPAIKKTEGENKAEAVSVTVDRASDVFDDGYKGGGAKKKDELAAGADKSPLKTSEKPVVSSSTFSQAEKELYLLKEASDGNRTGKKPVKFGVIVVIFSLVLIVLALFLNEDIVRALFLNYYGDTKTEPTTEQIDETIGLQKQREHEDARVKQLLLEAEILKKERDAAIQKLEEEKRAKEEAERLEKAEAEKQEKAEAEKAALAIKVAEENRRLAEKKRLEKNKERERRAKRAKAKAEAKAEVDRIRKLEVARIAEEERQVMQARLEREIRLKEEEEARRLGLELEERQRQEALQEAAAAEAAAKAKKKAKGCYGPSARYKASCRN